MSKDEVPAVGSISWADLTVADAVARFAVIRDPAGAVAALYQASA